MLELLKTIGLGIILFLPLTNPLTTVVLLLGLSADMNTEERNHQSKMACIYVFIIMIVSFYGGQLIMNTFGISIPGLRIAGGMIVGFLGFMMLFPQKSQSQSLPNEKQLTQQVNNIAFVPLAMPSTAGPGTIAMIISLSSSFKNGNSTITPWVIYTASILIPLVLCLILYICMRFAGDIMRFMGKSGIEATSRIMGFLLVCIGTQFVINGIKELILLFPN